MTGPPPERPDAEVLAFLEQFRDVVLFCRDAAGRPVGYPMRTMAGASPPVTFTTYRKSAKVRHIERDPRVTIFAADHGPGEVRWVSVAGRARIVAPSEERLRGLFEAPAHEARVPAGMGEFVKQRLRDGKRILIEVDALEASAVYVGRIS
jgi:hypothetical protein